MDVLLTGATGFIGRALTLRLLRDGHRVVAWVRSAERARAVLGGAVELVEATEPTLAVHRSVRSADAVVHLAGAGVFDGRWSARRKHELAASRVELTRSIVDAFATPRGPRVLVSASAVGYYGVRPAGTVTESSPAGDDFLAQLCAAWEREALRAEQHGARVAVIRTGVVLGRGGGALARMLPPFRAGVGGRLARGDQPVPWIQLADAVEVFARAVTDDAMRGPINAVAPNPVTNRELTRALARAVRRPAIVPVPAVALRAAFGEAASMLTGGQRVAPDALRARGFRFRFPTLVPALANLVGDDAASVARSGRGYVLRQTTVIDAPVAQVFAFFSDPANLGALTPPSLSFRLARAPARLAAGATIDYTLRLGPLPLAWRSELEVWEPGVRFVDVQRRGPYRAWSHEHRFDVDPADPQRTVMRDVVRYEVPLGWVGRLLHRLAVGRTLRALFAHRADAIRLRFGGEGDRTRQKAA